MSTQLSVEEQKVKVCVEQSPQKKNRQVHVSDSDGTVTIEEKVVTYKKNDKDNSSFKALARSASAKVEDIPTSTDPNRPYVFTQNDNIITPVRRSSSNILAKKRVFV